MKKKPSTTQKKEVHRILGTSGQSSDYYDDLCINDLTLCIFTPQIHQHLCQACQVFSFSLALAFVSIIHHTLVDSSVRFLLFVSIAARTDAWECWRLAML